MVSWQTSETYYLRLDGKPFDSAQDILDRGMTVFVDDGGEIWRDHLLDSSSPTYQKLGETLVVPKDYDAWTQMVVDGLLGANTHVYLGALWADEYALGDFYDSKDVLEGVTPFGGDIINKKWHLKDEYASLILHFQQVKRKLKSHTSFF